MEYLDAIALQLEKNFQVWHHRRCIMEMLKQGFDRELELLEEVFSSDSKNYHAWAYRLWLVERFELFVGEMDWVEDWLEDEVTNNSLWAYRRFLVVKTLKAWTRDVVDHEVQYTLKMLEKDPGNEAAWTYLRGWLAPTREVAIQS